MNSTLMNLITPLQSETNSLVVPVLKMYLLQGGQSENEVRYGLEVPFGLNEKAKCVPPGDSAIGPGRVIVRFG